MRPATILTMPLIFLALLNAGCKKDRIYTQTFKGKIGFYDCGTMIIDVEGASGTAGGVRWTEPGSGKVHENAITIKNFCYVNDQLRERNLSGSFTFRISKENRTAENNCGIYTCFISGASTEVYIYDVNN